MNLLPSPVDLWRYEFIILLARRIGESEVRDHEGNELVAGDERGVMLPLEGLSVALCLGELSQQILATEDRTGVGDTVAAPLYSGS